MGRFISADGFIFTSQSLLGNNMFAYCENNPVNFCDKDGENPLKVATDLLRRWIFGDGESVQFGKNSSLSRALYFSRTMRAKIAEEIDKYENGEFDGKGSVTFEKNEPDLWLGVRNANYELTVKKETKTVGFWIFQQDYSRYVVNVKVYDTYDFNTGDETNDGIGSVLNNWGYKMQEKGFGKKYSWEAKYVYTTGWKKK